MNKANKNLKIVGIFFFIIGLFYIALYVGCNILVEKVGNRIRTEAIVEKVSHDGIDIVYHVDGEELYAHLNEDQDDYHKGKKIKVYYDRNNHNDVFTIGFLDDISSLLCGFILIGIGLIFFIKYFKNDKKYKRLMLNGTIVSARIVNISRVGTSYIINCEFDGFDGKKYNYKSEALKFNPADILNYKEIDKIPVYVDMNNLKNYYVDISSLRQ